MKKNGNKELQSRREFFKKAAKGALPILGAIALASTPLLSAAKSHESEIESGCYYGCSGDCYGTCSGGCMGCTGGCTGSCSGGCAGQCSGSCRGTCMFGCRGITR